VLKVALLSFLLLLVSMLPVLLESPPARPVEALPFDLVVEGLDINGWPLNPKWGAQTGTSPALPDPYKCPGLEPWGMGLCTSSRSWTDASSSKCPDTIFKHVWFPGHVNFTGATFTGPIEWLDHSSDDDDYNLIMGTPNAAGLTNSNPGGLQLEFDSDETIDHFHTSWWQAFHDAVDRGQDDARAMLHGKDAIAFGVFGLDCAHNCSSELHPVLALAIHLGGTQDDDAWAFFVRNWGNEGYCSSGSETLADSINEFTFTLPWPGATAVEEVSREFLCRGLGGAGPRVDLIPKQGAAVTFGFPKASLRERINGVLHLRWTGPPASKKPSPAILAAALKPDRKETESRAWVLINQMNPMQRKLYERFRPVSDKSVDSVAPLKLTRNIGKATKRKRDIEHVPDAARDARDRKQMEAIRRAYGGHLPR
jgi:hypothetical protein